MANIEASVTARNIWKVEPGSAERPAAIESISAWHLDLLPQTAGSKAGSRALTSLYEGLTADPHGIVLFAAKGGFASGTTDLRKTEAWLKKALPFFVKARLGFAHLAAPGHLISRWRWETNIPSHDIGYILTIGVRAGSNLRGKEMLAQLEGEFIRAGRKESWVDTEEKNKSAREFYLRNGYAEVSRVLGHCLLVKRLAPASPSKT